MKDFRELAEGILLKNLPENWVFTKGFVKDIAEAISRQYERGREDGQKEPCNCKVYESGWNEAIEAVISLLEKEPLSVHRNWVLDKIKELKK